MVLIIWVKSSSFFIALFCIAFICIEFTLFHITHCFILHLASHHNWVLIVLFSIAYDSMVFDFILHLDSYHLYHISTIFICFHSQIWKRFQSFYSFHLEIIHFSFAPMGKISNELFYWKCYTKTNIRLAKLMSYEINKKWIRLFHFWLEILF